MNKLTVTLETVTPLFMGGADQQAELRPSEFRGALRFWWRALWGGTHGDNLEKMREAEAHVFGDTRQASGIVVRSTPLTANQLEVMDERAPGKGNLDYSYLFYGLVKDGKPYKTSKGESRLKYRQSVKPAEKLELTLTLRPGQSNESAWVHACASLWLLTHLGGIGARSRRGAGSIQCVAIDGNWQADVLPTPTFLADTPQIICRKLTLGVQQLKQALWWGENASLKRLPQFDILDSHYAEIYVIDKTWPDWKSALTAFARSLGKFRDHYDPDYAGVKKVAASGQGTFEAERAAFGLPLPFYFSSTKNKAVVEGTEHDRRSSPLLVRAVHYSNGQYGLVVTFFRSILLPEKQLRAGNSARGPVPNFDIVDNYLKSLSNPGSKCYLAPKLRVTL